MAEVNARPARPLPRFSGSSTLFAGLIFLAGARRVVQLGPDCVVVQSVDLSYLGPSEYIPGVEGPTPPYLLEVVYFVDPELGQSCTGIPALEDPPGFRCIDHWVVDVERVPE